MVTLVVRRLQAARAPRRMENGIRTRAQAARAKAAGDEINGVPVVPGRVPQPPVPPQPDYEVLERPEPTPRPLLRRLAHWGPVLALLVISEISVATINAHLEWWHPADSLLAAANLAAFLLFAFGTVSNLFTAAVLGPRYVPFGWTPVSFLPRFSPLPHLSLTLLRSHLQERKEDRGRVQFCSICQSYKAPRSHHCRKCNRCCCKMDHHCKLPNNLLNMMELRESVGQARGSTTAWVSRISRPL